MDADHLDIYGDASQLAESFGLFAGQLKAEGTLYVKAGLPLQQGVNYSAGDEGRLKGTNIRVEGARFVFDYVDGDFSITDLQLMVPGRHNVENAVAAIAVALRLGIAPELLKAAIGNFKGVKRRFEYIVSTPGHIYIDDYAHHPEELKACFSAIRQLYPGKKLTAVFQPHLFTRTRDFADDFASVLGTVDELLLLHIYPARELPLEGIDAEYLLSKITLDKKEVCAKDEVLEKIKMRKPELLVTVGAGDIDTLIEPLKAILTNA